MQASSGFVHFKGQEYQRFMDLIHTLKQQFNALSLQSKQPLIVAYSGGLDSHVLLHTLSILRNSGLINHPLRAIHIHHGLSPNADAWLAHCQQTCHDLNIDFTGAKVNLASDSGESLEALARHARYDKLFELAQVNSVMLLGQHQDDQLETVLLQLKRGAGPKGLSAMANFSTKSVGTQNKVIHLLRPFLAVSQASILAYAQRQQLTWVEDESNQNTDFERNFLRLQIVPQLIKKWPDIAKTVSRSATLCAEQQNLLDEVAQEKLQAVQNKDNTLNLASLGKLSTSWLYQVVRHWLNQQNIQSPSQAILHKLKPELMDAKEDAKPIIQWGNWQFRRFDQQLYVVALTPTIPSHMLLWHEQKTVELPAPLGSLNKIIYQGGELNSFDLILAPLKGELKIQFGGFSQRFKPLNSPHAKPLKQWYKEWKVPPWKRDKIALLLQNDLPLALLINGAWCLSNAAPSQPVIGSTLLRYTHPQINSLC